jgi:hypothetical protein
MRDPDSHLSDEQLLLNLEGELSSREEKRVRRHLEACWQCRARRQELQDATVDFVRVERLEFDRQAPPAAAPRALLKASLGQLSAGSRESSKWFPSRSEILWASAIGSLLAAGLLFVVWGGGRIHRGAHAEIFSVPDRRLTPGATILVSRRDVCAQAEGNNKAVPATVQKLVFQEYGITGADPRAYEVDYLVTPALGGADDIRNLWPHSYDSTLWNATVKDALEQHLREMVCNGNLDLAEAQQEIAADWITAYKKYFHTDEPLAAHRRHEFPEDVRR